MAAKKTAMSLTELLFFDTDCLSAFLWVDSESILARLYPRRIVIPSQVYSELSNARLNHIKGLRAQTDILIQSGHARVESIDVGSETYKLYHKLTHAPDPGHKIIGDGEAAAISMAKEQGGILASNNLKDISDYVREFGLIHVTTGAIMKAAMDANLMNEAQGNAIWKSMLSKRRRLGYDSFSDYLKANRTNTTNRDHPS